MLWLIAEDEADIRNLVSMMCTVWGHTPLPLDSGHQAWEFLDKVEAGTYDGPLPDFALMDIRMPGPRGNEVAKRIRTLAPIKNMPIVLMTAFVLSDDERTEMIATSGVDHIINKPLPDFEELRNMLHGIIEKRQSVASAAPPAVAETPATPAPPAAAPAKAEPSAPQPPPAASAPPEPGPARPSAASASPQEEVRTASNPDARTAPDDGQSSQDRSS